MSAFDYGNRSGDRSSASYGWSDRSYDDREPRAVGSIEDAIAAARKREAAPELDPAPATEAWRPVSREAELVAIVTDGEQMKALGAKAGWEQRITAIKRVADGLSADENMVLLQRIKRQAPGDTFALALTPGVRMTAAHATSLFKFLEDARRRDALRGGAQRPGTGAPSVLSAPVFAADTAAPTEGARSFVGGRSRSGEGAPDAATAAKDAMVTVTNAAARVARSSDGTKHVERPVEEYLRHNSELAWARASAYLENARFSAPGPGLQWRDARAFARATVAHLRTMHLFDRHAALLDVTFPIDPYYGIVPLLPTTNDWVPTIGDALGQAFEQAIDNSVRRLGPRWREQARYKPESAGIADETQSLVAATSLIASAPIDLAVREGLTHGATIEMLEALPVPGKAGKAPRLARHVDLEWVGQTDPRLWYCVRPSLADATTEEVSAALDREKHGLAEGGSTLDAFRLVKVGDVFALPTSWARTFPRVKALGPHAADERPDVYTAIASSTVIDRAALADSAHGEAPAPGAKTQAATSLIDELTESQLQLAYIAKALGPHHLSAEAMAGQPWLARKQVELATATVEERAEWTPLIAGQVKRLHEIGEGLKEVLSAATGAQPSPQLRKVLAKYAHAAAVSQFADASAQLVQEAKAEASLVTLTAMRSSTNDLSMAIGTGSGVDARDLTHAEALQAETRALQGKLVRGEGVDADAVEANLLNTQELSLQVRVEQLGNQLRVIDHEIKAAGDGLMSTLVTQFDGKFRSLDETVAAFRGHLQWFDGDWHNDPGIAQANAIRDPDEHDRVMTKARQARLATAQAHFAGIRNDKDLVHALQNGAAIIQRHETATRIAKACGQMLVMIGIGIVASAAGGYAARAVAAIGEGSEAIEGAGMMARIARGARTVGSKLVGAEVEGAINAVGQVAMQGGSIKDAMTENVLLSLGSNVILSRFGHHLEFAEDIERKSGSMWQRATSGGAVVLAKGITITSHVILNAAMSYVAHQIVAHGHAEPTSTQLSEWFLQGAAVAIGRYVHGQLDSRRALRDKLELAHGFERAQRLLGEYDRVLALAIAAENAPNDEKALALLGAHHEMVREEIAVLEAAMTDPAKARALDLAEPALKALHAQYGEAMAGLKAAGLAKLPLYHAGLQDVANGDAWRGTQKQIDAALDHARRAGMPVEVAADPTSGIQHATIDGEAFDLIVISEGAGAKERHGAKDGERAAAESAAPAASRAPSPHGSVEAIEPTDSERGEIQHLRDLLLRLDDAKRPLDGRDPDRQRIKQISDEITAALDALNVTGMNKWRLEGLVLPKLGGRERQILADQFRDPVPVRKHVVADANKDGISDGARVGVSAMAVPSTIPRIKNLPPEQAAAQERFARAYETEGGREALADDYLERVTAEYDHDGRARSQEERKTFATDDAKRLSPDYELAQGSDAERNRAKATMNLAVHQTANAVAKEAFLMRLDAVASADPGATVMVTAGGVGAGKSYAIENNPEARAMVERAAVIWDSAGEQNSTELPWVIAEAKKRGLVVEILYVHQTPDKSWPRVVGRAQKQGRMVDARLHAESYAEGARNFDAVQRQFPGVKTVVIDVSNTTVEKVDRLSSDALDVDADTVHQRNAEDLRARDDVPAHIKEGGMTQGEGVWGAPNHRGIIAELGEIPVAHLPPGTIVEGTPQPLDRSTYYVNRADGQRLLELAARLGPTVQTRAYRKGFLLRRTTETAGEWYFEFRDVDVPGADSVSTRRADGLPPPNAATVEVWGFSGVRKINGRPRTEWTAEERAEFDRVKEFSPLMWAGHIGISLDGGRTIIGFTPDVSRGMSTAEGIAALLRHEAFPGILGDDTAIFLEAAALARDRGWDTNISVAVELVDTPAKMKTLDEVARLSNMKPGEHGYGYGFPLEPGQIQPGGEPFGASNGFSASCVRNCGAFPAKLGVKIPEPTGQVKLFLPELQKWADEDAPKDFRSGSPNGEEKK